MHTLVFKMTFFLTVISFDNNTPLRRLLRSYSQLEIALPLLS